MGVEEVMGGDMLLKWAFFEGTLDLGGFCMGAISCLI